MTERPTPAAPSDGRARLAALAASDPVLRAARAVAGDDRVSLVGGAVRDALLDRPAEVDLDLVVEGDAPALARRLARRLSAPFQIHERFATAAIETGDGRRVDLTTARSERYAAPGALPDVAAGSLLGDLARRDFSVNAMAYRLTGPAAGELIDPHAGGADIERRLIRILRDDAFSEDPSRLVRAARYAARLGFALAPATAAAGQRTAPRLDPASARVAGEFGRLLGEPQAGTALAILRDLGVPWVSARPGPELTASFAALDAALALPGAPPVVAWAARLGAAVTALALDQMAVPGWARATARAAREGPALAAAIGQMARPSQVDAALRAAAPAAALTAAIADGGAVARWWAAEGAMAPSISGADLIAAGVPPGPAIGRALAEVRAALLDGEVGGRDEQLALALRVARG